VQLGRREIVGDNSYIRGARGNRVSMIFQDAVSALNSTFTIGDQFREVLRRGDPTISTGAAMRRARAAPSPRGPRRRPPPSHPRKRRSPPQRKRRPPSRGSYLVRDRM
jgi:ABC-type dipeptide/oligopeptide/nickel transport system ATPase component